MEEKDKTLLDTDISHQDPSEKDDSFSAEKECDSWVPLTMKLAFNINETSPMGKIYTEEVLKKAVERYVEKRNGWIITNVYAHYLNSHADFEKALSLDFPHIIGRIKGIKEIEDGEVFLDTEISNHMSKFFCEGSKLTFTMLGPNFEKVFDNEKFAIINFYNDERSNCSVEVKDEQIKDLYESSCYEQQKPVKKTGIPLDQLNDSPINNEIDPSSLEDVLEPNNSQKDDADGEGSTS